jgi:HPt (histidine-containing phosphotransfer) domain-containing protein
MAPPDDLQTAIAALWLDARPRTFARIETLEAAIAALGDGGLDADLRERARQEAHKLTGSLGTFGMPDGSTHARVIELRLEDGATAADAPALAEHLAALRRAAESGPG